MTKSNKASVTIPEPPDHLSQWSKNFWRQVAGTRVKSIGRLAFLQTGLEERDRAEQSGLKIGDNLTLITPRSGCEHLNPLLKVEKESRQLFVKVMDASE